MDEFEGTLNITNNKALEHHNSTISSQSSFQKDLNLLLSVIHEVENPFSNNKYVFYSLNTKYVVLEDVVSSTLPNLLERGEKQLYEFLKIKVME